MKSPTMLEPTLLAKTVGVPPVIGIEKKPPPAEYIMVVGVVGESRASDPIPPCPRLISITVPPAFGTRRTAPPPTCSPQ